MSFRISGCIEMGRIIDGELRPQGTILWGLDKKGGTCFFFLSKIWPLIFLPEERERIRSFVIEIKRDKKNAQYYPIICFCSKSFQEYCLFQN